MNGRVFKGRRGRGGSGSKGRRRGLTLLPDEIPEARPAHSDSSEAQNG